MKFSCGSSKKQEREIGYTSYTGVSCLAKCKQNCYAGNHKKILGCGYIKPNHRTRENDKSNVLVVRNHNDLAQKVIPFFKKHSILSSKKYDFDKFEKIVSMIGSKKHLKRNSLKQILRIAFSMNENGKYRKIKYSQVIKYLESSETVRQTRIQRRSLGALTL
jgi:hypothetical protein